MIVDRIPAWVRPLLGAGCLLLLLAMASELPAQEGQQVLPERSTSEAPKKSEWDSKWRFSFESEFDENTFKLKPSQRRSLEDGAARYEGMESPLDVVNTLRMRGEFRRPGLRSRRMSIGGDARIELFTLNQRRSSVELEAFAAQKLSKRDIVGAAVSFTPSEFRRNYLIGADGSGAARYEAGVAHTVEGEIEYEREVLRGRRGGPKLDATVALLGGRRIYQGFSWRNRTELGGQVEADLVLAGRIGLKLEAERVRASHDGGAEPVLEADGVSYQSLNRNFDQTSIGAETNLRLAKRRVSLSYEWRDRSYLARLGEDGVYGDRVDDRRTYGIEADILSRGQLRLSIGGKHQDQTSYVPGRGDTGDEADYSRSTIFLHLSISR